MSEGSARSSIGCPAAPRRYPLVTIITVVYNARDLLVKTIEAVSQMAYPEIEHIIIDGASTDGTQDVLERYKHCISRGISEPDHGIYDAMNKGISLATGEYLWFLNAGDVPATSNVLDVMTSLEWVPDYVYGDTNLVRPDGTVLKLVRAPSRLDWRGMVNGMQVSHQSFIVRRSLAPFYDLRYRYIADQKWIVEILRVSGAGLRLKCPLSDYLLGGLSHRRFGCFVIEKIRYSFSEMALASAVWITIKDIAKAGKFYLGSVVRPRGL